MITYSLTKKRNPIDSEAPEKIYATAQRLETWDLEQLAAHISDHNSKYNRADVSAVLISLIDCMKELLLDGNSIKLGEFGTFYITLKSRGVEVDDADEGYSTSNIVGVRVGWRRGTIFDDLLQNASFTLVPTRALQKAAKETMKDNVFGDSTADKDTEPGEQTGDTGDSGSGSGEGSGNDGHPE